MQRERACAVRREANSTTLMHLQLKMLTQHTERAIARNRIDLIKNQ